MVQYGETYGNHDVTEKCRPTRSSGPNAENTPIWRSVATGRQHLSYPALFPSELPILQNQNSIHSVCNGMIVRDDDEACL